MSHTDFVRDFLKAIGRDQVVGDKDHWYFPDAVQVEFPNKLLPKGATRNLADLKAAGERGRAIVERQTYEVVSTIESGDAVAVEAIFRATFKVDMLGLPKGQTMTARFAMFFTMQDGRISRHHTYDCFEPW